MSHTSCAGSALAVAATLAAGAVAAETVAVERGRFRHTVILTCELEAVNSASITAPRGIRSGSNFTLAELADEGTFVRAGDIVLRFDSSDVNKARIDSETELLTARNDIEIKRLEAAAKQAELRAKIAEAEAALEKARLDASVAAGIKPLSELTDAKHEEERARVELERQRQALATAEREVTADLAILRITEEKALARLAQAERGLSAFVVSAPQDGIVVHASDWNDRKVQLGDSVYTGQAAMYIQDLSEMRAKCDLDQSDRHLVRIGQRVELRVDARPSDVFAATVAAITPFAESLGRGWWQRSDVRVFKVTVDIERSDTELMKPGLTARADVEVRAEDGLLLPRRAVRYDPAGGGWYVRTPGGARTPVEVAARNGSQALLAAGVAERQAVEVTP